MEACDITRSAVTIRVNEDTVCTDGSTIECAIFENKSRHSFVLRVFCFLPTHYFSFKQTRKLELPSLFPKMHSFTKIDLWMENLMCPLKNWFSGWKNLMSIKMVCHPSSRDVVGRCQGLFIGKLPRAVIASHSSVYGPKFCLRETTMTFIYGDQTGMRT